MKQKTLELLSKHFKSEALYVPDSPPRIECTLTVAEIRNIVRSEFGFITKKSRHLKKHLKRILNELLRDLLSAVPKNDL